MKFLATHDDRDKILTPEARQATILRLLQTGRYDAFQLARSLDCSVGAAHLACLDLMAAGKVLPSGGGSQRTVWELRKAE